MTGKGTRSSGSNLMDGTTAYLNRLLEGVGTVQRHAYNAGAVVVAPEHMHALLSRWQGQGSRTVAGILTDNIARIE